MRDLNQKKGVALLYTVLTISIILAISITLLSFVLKQYNITSSSRNSVIAIYAADAGIECALLWDIRGHEYYQPAGIPTKVIPSTTNPDIGSGQGILCSGVDISTQFSPPAYPLANTVVSTFELTLGNSCTVVQITKFYDGVKENTEVFSRGYNVTCGTRTTNLNAVERAIKVNYIFN